jgi:propanol-preferring alcohol dehydrogenase
MLAWRIYKQAPVTERPLQPEEVERPQPEENEVLIRVKACGVCRTDLHIVEGDLPLRKQPIIPGHQVVGYIEQTGSGVSNLRPGDRVGAAWLAGVCGVCRFCLSGRENLCEAAEFNGWTRDGGYAEYMTARADFVYRIPDGFPDLSAAPLLCAGIIGYRALRKTGIANWRGARLGIYGFGAAGHIAIQIAINRGADVYVATRDRQRHAKLAEELGAVWVGDTFDIPPVKLDAAIIFAPAGEIVPAALPALDKGGRLVLGGIHMSEIPPLKYEAIYGERSITSVANNTREDGTEFLAEAAAIPVRTSIAQFSLDEAMEALISLKTDAVKGAAVIVM